MWLFDAEGDKLRNKRIETAFYKQCRFFLHSRKL